MDRQLLPGCQVEINTAVGQTAATFHIVHFQGVITLFHTREQLLQVADRIDVGTINDCFVACYCPFHFCQGLRIHFGATIGIQGAVSAVGKVDKAGNTFVNTAHIQNHFFRLAITQIYIDIIVTAEEEHHGIVVYTSVQRFSIPARNSGQAEIDLNRHAIPVVGIGLAFVLTVTIAIVVDHNSFAVFRVIGQEVATGAFRTADAAGLGGGIIEPEVSVAAILIVRCTVYVAVEHIVAPGFIVAEQSISRTYTGNTDIASVKIIGQQSGGQSGLDIGGVTTICAILRHIGELQAARFSTPGMYRQISGIFYSFPFLLAIAIRSGFYQSYGTRTQVCDVIKVVHRHGDKSGSIRRSYFSGLANIIGSRNPVCIEDHVLVNGIFLTRHIFLRSGNIIPGIHLISVTAGSANLLIGGQGKHNIALFIGSQFPVVHRHTLVELVTAVGWINPNLDGFSFVIRIQLGTGGGNLLCGLCGRSGVLRNGRLCGRGSCRSSCFGGLGSIGAPGGSGFLRLCLRLSIAVIRMLMHFQCADQTAAIAAVGMDMGLVLRSLPRAGLHLLHSVAGIAMRMICGLGLAAHNSLLHCIAGIRMGVVRRLLHSAGQRPDLASAAFAVGMAFLRNLAGQGAFRFVAALSMDMVIDSRLCADQLLLIAAFCMSMGLLSAIGLLRRRCQRSHIRQRHGQCQKQRQCPSAQFHPPQAVSPFPVTPFHSNPSKFLPSIENEIV